MIDFKAERAAMIESQIRPNAVTDARLLAAMYRTPRESFVPPSLQPIAYMDGSLKVEPAHDGRPARYLLAPMVFARLVQLARVKADDRILDIGPATGYSTAILAQLGKEVIAVECDAGLLAVAKEALESEHITRVKTVMNALEEGVPDHAPFDVIFVNGRLNDAPERLLKQLASGGRMVAVVGSEVSAKAKLYTKINDTIQSVTDSDSGAPALPGFEFKAEFVF